MRLVNKKLFYAKNLRRILGPKIWELIPPEIKAIESVGFI